MGGQTERILSASDLLKFVNKYVEIFKNLGMNVSKVNKYAERF